MDNLNNSGSRDIQRLFDNVRAGGVVSLPGGEFEGPFKVSRTCTVIGSNTTLWSGTDCILTVEAPGVRLKNLRIEITNENLPPHRNIAVYSTNHDTEFENVEVIGSLAGIEGEENFRQVPKVLPLGRFCADKSNIFTAVIEVPVITEISAQFYDVSITPNVLNPGKNTVSIVTSPMRSGSYIYGEVLLISKVRRRITLSGQATDEMTEAHDGTLIFEPRETVETELFEEPGSFVIYPETEYNHSSEQILYSPDADDEYVIRRGQLITLEGNRVEIEIMFALAEEPLDIDTYAFMTGADGMVKSSGRLVFFNNISSSCGSVQYLNAPDKRVMYVDLKALPDDVEQIDIVFSIYGDSSDIDFSVLNDPAIRTACGGVAYIFPLTGNMKAKTVVGISINKKGGSFALSPLGMIYKNGIAALCGDYGIKSR